MTEKHVKIKFSIREDQLASMHRIACKMAVENKTYKNDMSEVLRTIIDLVLGDKNDNKDEGLFEANPIGNGGKSRKTRRKGTPKGGSRRP